MRQTSDISLGRRIIRGHDSLVGRQIGCLNRSSSRSFLGGGVLGTDLDLDLRGPAGFLARLHRIPVCAAKQLTDLRDHFRLRPVEQIAVILPFIDAEVQFHRSLFVLVVAGLYPLQQADDTATDCSVRHCHSPYR